LRHLSTRGEAAGTSFSDVLLAGLARDGGLYVPESWPVLPAHEIADIAGQSFGSAASTVLAKFVGDEIVAPVLVDMTRSAYATFRHPAVCPIVQIDDNLFILELFHGPTLAFKDVAMQILARMMDHALGQRGERATIVGATSGDTGSAAIEAFGGLDQVDIFILYPHGRVSEVQRRQMTTVGAHNVHAIAIEGTFDDCQALVKGMFNHHAFREELRLSGVNSINWARIAAQVTYYFTAGVSLGAPHRKVSFSVPTGNFGDILAGWVAKRMGLPIDRLVIATNVNDILSRTLSSGRYEVRDVEHTTSPSMDIQVSSNFERLLFEAHDRDASAIRRLMAGLGQSGAFEIEAGPLARIRQEFDAFRTTEDETARLIQHYRREAGYLLDPHTAVGVGAALERQRIDSRVPMVVLGTAHPAKFPDAVERACGERPALPEHLADLYARREHTSVLPADQAGLEAFIRARSRVLAGAAR
jgi:threonine synthase